MSRCPKDGARQNINASSVSYRPCSLSVALARSRSISLSPSPDKSEPEVVGIASNPYRVHQTEYIRRQYCSYILTIQDNLTKYSLAIPLVSFTSEEIAEAFMKNFICQYGCPKAILTDQGSSFIGSIMKKFAKVFNIEQFNSSTFHPQSNGSLERSHHVLIEYLKHYITKEKQWDQWFATSNVFLQYQCT